MRQRGIGWCTVLLSAGAAMGVGGRQQEPVRAAGLIAVTAQSGASLRAWDATVDAMRRNGELTLSRSRADTVLPGHTHERYQQYVDGIRVAGAEITRQLAGGVTTSIYGELRQVAAVDVRPRVSEDAARDLLRRGAIRDVPGNRPLELVIFRAPDGTDVLAYSAHVWTARGWMQTYLDAADGRVRLQFNDLQTQSAVGSGTGVLGDTKKISATVQSGRYAADDSLRPPSLITYDLQGNLPRTKDYLDGLYVPTASDVASDADNVWTDGGNVDAHVYLGYTYDYYFKRFGRRGLDDRNAPIYGVSHPVRRTDYRTLLATDDEYFVNAFYCPACGPLGRGAIVFGDGLPAGVTSAGRTFDYLAGALDVVAHELTHAVTGYTSGLLYQDESGALNESYSDIVGTSVEFFFQPPGAGPGKADYLIAEDVARPGGFRSMADPGLFGDPDHYSRRYTGTADNGGVHRNAGIPNQAFYLAVEGGVNRTSGLGVAGVGAANREQIEKVFYRAFAFLLPATATFSTARAATIQAARELYGATSAAERAVTQAWTAVGVN